MDNKPIKFEIQELLAVGMVIVVLTIMLAYGADVLDSQKDTLAQTLCSGSGTTFTSYNSTSNVCYNSSGSSSDAPLVASTSFNTTVQGEIGNYSLAEKIPTIAKVAAAAVIIGILVVYLWGRVMPK